MSHQYANAYAEVWAILECLEEEEYNKIPQNFLQALDENRNLNYEYEINEQQDLEKQPMLIETKAILLNIFRDYLASPEQREKIIKWQNEDRAKLEEIKKETYKVAIFENKELQKKELVEVKEQKTWKIIIEKIKNIFSVIKGTKKM